MSETTNAVTAAPTILTQSRPNTDKARAIELPLPMILQHGSLKPVVKDLGEDLALAKIQNQLTIDFRSKIRALLESETDGAQTYSDEQILAMDFSDWKPELRTRKSKTEKVADMLEGMDQDEMMAAIAKAGIDIEALLKK